MPRPKPKRIFAEWNATFSTSGSLAARGWKPGDDEYADIDGKPYVRVMHQHLTPESIAPGDSSISEAYFVIESRADCRTLIDELTRAMDWAWPARSARPKANTK